MHGSERRGSTPVPAPNFAFRQKQSREERQKLLLSLRRQSERIAESEEVSNLGNKELPAFNHKLELIANIETHKAVIVGGETGSGKSTQLPQYLYEAGYDMTIMLVPRRVIANGLGDRVRDELAGQIENFEANEVVGIVHGERVERHENNKILVMTPNTFIKMQDELKTLYGDKKLAVVADEIHEANVFTEIALGVAALSVRDNDQWRLVAASATHNIETLQKPFETLNNGYVPSVEIEGRPHDVTLHEESALTPMQAYARNGATHGKSMLFTSGKNEIQFIINETRRELELVERGSSQDVEFRILHGKLTELELSHINDPVPEGKRLVIVSTPAGMSGITIPGVTHVATDGTINRSELDDDNASGLNRSFLSKAEIIQEIGRAGRDVPGGIGVLCLPVFSDKKERRANKKPRGIEGGEQININVLPGLPYIPFEDRIEHAPPEIYSANLARIVLSVAAAGYDFSEINEFIPHPVQKANIISAEQVLKRLGALSDDGLVTTIGTRMDKFPVTPELGRGLYEASSKSQSAQHMARAAFIASAIDVGGLVDHKADEDAVKARGRLVRETTSDDFIAQLDIMTSLYGNTGDDETTRHFVEQHGLDAKHVERVRKTARKVLAVMGLRPENIIVTPPLHVEEQQLRDDFTTGFTQYLYENIGVAPRSKKALYRNVLGNESSTQRTISDRSLSTLPPDQLFAGIPRWYFKGMRKDGTRIKHDIIDFVFPVRREVVGEYVLANGLIEKVWHDSRVKEGYVVDYKQAKFGSIIVGVPERAKHEEAISSESQKVLFDYVIAHQGRAQTALRQLASELEGYRQRTPAAILSQVRKPDAPEDITQQIVTEMVQKATMQTQSAHGVEHILSDNIYRNNYTLEKYYDLETLAALNELSPLQLRLDGQNLHSVRYDDGQPYVTNLTKRYLEKIKEPIYLADGREVLYQRQLAGGGKERVSFGR